MPKFRFIRLPRSRRLVDDVLRLYQKMPSCAHDRRCNFSELSNLRSQLPERISWPALFIKAFAILSDRHPVLRQTWQSWPWPHLREYSNIVANVATHREYQNQPWLCWSKISDPHKKPLAEIHRQLVRYKTDPVEKAFKQQLQLSMFPGFLRRALWWWNMNLVGSKRPKRLGTYLLTTLASKNVEIQHPPGFLTANWTYGPLDEHGNSKVTLVYDHRLMDGSTVADIMADLERIMNEEIAAEMRAVIVNSEVQLSKAA